MSKTKMLPDGCGYQGYEFGAGSYPDSQCFGGRLYDMDACDEPGTVFEPSEYIPCPMCLPRKAIDYWADRNMRSGELAANNARKAAECLVADIRKNRQNGTEPWNGARLGR